MHLLEVVRELRLHFITGALDELRGKLRLWGDDHKGGPEERVRPGCEDGNRLWVPLDHEVHFGTVAPANPIALHGQDFLRPAALQLVQVIEQPVGVVGDFEIPLGELLFHHDRTTAVGGAIG
ncbi:MAG: Uncharacterised protein [Cellulomonadaceae bacterium TMED98]|nr:MAG: Uncharacterised protein [Cellulomonadaceae bacterium TMED98]